MHCHVVGITTNNRIVWAALCGVAAVVTILEQKTAISVKGYLCDSNKINHYLDRPKTGPDVAVLAYGWQNYVVSVCGETVVTTVVEQEAGVSAQMGSVINNDLIIKLPD